MNNQQTQIQAIEDMEERERFYQEVQATTGSYCELRSPDDILSCTGRVQSMVDDKITIVPDGRAEMPMVIFNTVFKIIIRPQGGSPLILYGQICGSTKGMWKLNRLRRALHMENRAYFRQSVSARAWVACVNELYHPKAEGGALFYAEQCSVMDISLEGIQIQSTRRYERGDWLLVTGLFLLPEANRQYAFLCQICWADRLSHSEFLFGCHISPMKKQTQDWLSSDIFALQRQAIQAKRR